MRISGGSSSNPQFPSTNTTAVTTTTATTTTTTTATAEVTRTNVHALGTTTTATHPAELTETTSKDTTPESDGFSTDVQRSEISQLSDQVRAVQRANREGPREMDEATALQLACQTHKLHLVQQLLQRPDILLLD